MVSRCEIGLWNLAKVRFQLLSRAHVTNRFVWWLAHFPPNQPHRDELSQAAELETCWVHSTGDSKGKMNYIASPKKSIAHSSFLSSEFRTKQTQLYPPKLQVQKKQKCCASWSAKKPKSLFGDAHPLKMFLLMYWNILIKKIFHFEASYYGSQHGSRLHLTAPYCTLLHILTFDL